MSTLISAADVRPVLSQGFQIRTPKTTATSTPRWLATADAGTKTPTPERKSASLRGLRFFVSKICWLHLFVSRASRACQMGCTPPRDGLQSLRPFTRPVASHSADSSCLVPVAPNAATKARRRRWLFDSVLYATVFYFFPDRCADPLSPHTAPCLSPQCAVAAHQSLDLLQGCPPPLRHSGPPPLRHGRPRPGGGRSPNGSAFAGSRPRGTS